MFGFRPQPPDAEHLRREEESRRNLTAGGLPLPAVERLKRLAAQQGTPQHLFSSDLSVAELALVEDLGFVALGQVMGTSFYQLGMQWRTANWRDKDQGKAFGYEMEVLTAGWGNARRLALGRLQQEAELLGATGVVGVKLKEKAHVKESGAIEFSAHGTAIRERELPPLREGSPPRKLFLSTFSGQEFWVLRQAGFRPVGILVGNCVYFQVLSNDQWRVLMRLNAPNQELTEVSEAMYAARRLALNRLEEQAGKLGATGLVDVQVDAQLKVGQTGDETETYGAEYHFTLIGTGIADAPPPPRRAPLDIVLPLR